MISVHKLMIGAIWIPTGHLHIYGATSYQTYMPAEELSLHFLCWDATTFYGTMCDTSIVNGIPCITLSARKALDLFASWQSNNLLEYEWLEETQSIRQVAKFLKYALANGYFAPDFEKWKSGLLGWKLLFPPEIDLSTEDFLSNNSVTAEQLWEQLKQNVSYAEDWLQHIISELLTQEDSIQSTWEQVVNEYPILQSSSDTDIWHDEEDWLVAIGWKQDQSPYKTVLQLLEPIDDEPWKLVVLLQDTKNPTSIYSYDFTRTMSNQPLPTTWKSYPERVQKDVQTWIRLIPWLASHQQEISIMGTAILQEITDDQAYEFLVTASGRLIDQGYTILLPAWWKELNLAKPKLKINVTSSVATSPNANFGLQQLMQFDWKLAIGNIEVSEEEFEAWFEQKTRLLKFRGHWIPLDPALVKQMRQLMKQFAKKGELSFRDVLEMYFLQSVNIDTDAELLSDTNTTLDDPIQEIQMEVELNQQLLGMMEQLKQTRSIPLVPDSPAFHGQLRNYQREGVTWLLFLRSLGLGGCLADDMGLGKTIQWINYLLHIYKKSETTPAEVAAPQQPSLLVCPTSVLGNWQKELARFAPSLSVYLHHGPTRKKGDDFVQAIKFTDVVLTSYSLAHIDEQELKLYHWNAICLDEAQNIKNVYTKQSAAIRNLEANHLVAMTGTPMENRLTELWSIFDFINPGYLGSLRSFQTRFVTPIEKQNDSTRIEQVKRLVQPFLLRRVKHSPEIELDLPEKQESKLYVSLTVEQAALYESLIQDMFERLEALDGMKRRGLILSTLTRIKQLCDHPALMLKEADTGDWANRSNKMKRLLEMVQELRQEGDSCLIFTQFVEMGHLLQNMLESEIQEPVLFLHGGTPKAARDRMIEQFQDRSLPTHDQQHIFLLSLKAGGVGLNLTSANHVFHFDRWWNPAVENQATDRAFRIGQTKHVQVFKFVTLGTLEERIDELIERKQGLNHQIIGSGENWITEMSTEDLRDLFVLRNEWVEVGG